MTPIEHPQARQARGISTRKPTIGEVGDASSSAPNKSVWRMLGNEVVGKVVVKVRV
jgi:hypothetical protein